MSKPKFLILGGGFAGVTLAQQLSTVADVTLVDSKDYFELSWALVRAFIDQNVAQKVIIPYKSFPNIGNLVIANVTTLTSKDATLSDGTVLTFDYVAICTGAKYSDRIGKSAFTSTADRLGELKAIGAEVAAAKDVLIVGGGPAGVEIAGEIMAAHPTKAVTLVHSKDRLLDGQKPAVGATAQKWLESKGVKVILNDRVERGATPGTVATNNGVSISASTIVWCTGISPNTSYLQTSLPDILDERGFVKVDKTLTVEGYPHMFALGDCTNVPETKKGFLANKQGLMVAKNFIAKQKKPNAKQAAWVPNMGFEAMFVTLGPKYGVAQMGSMVLKGWAPTMMKSKGLFIDQYRKLFKIQA